MGLDHRAGAAESRTRFDQIGVQRSLRQKLHAFDFSRLRVEHFNKRPADDLALAFGLGHSFEPPEKYFSRPDKPQVDVQVFFEHVDDAFCLALPQDAVIDKNTGQLTADRPVEQHRRDRRIHAAGKSEDDLFLSHLPADILHGPRNERFHRPGPGAAAEPEQKIGQHFAAFAGVNHLGMELQAVKAPPGVLGRRNLRIGCGSRNGKSPRQLADGIAVAHPAGRFLLHAGKEAFLLFDEKFGEAVFAFGRSDHPTAQRIHHELQTVADPQHRNSQIKDAAVRARGAFGVNAGRTAGQNDAFRRHRPDGGKRKIGRLNPAVHLLFPHPPRDELIVLRAEINNQNHEGFLSS